MIKIATDKNKIEKKIIIVMMMNLLLLPFTPLKAEDYPSAYLGSGYREYLSGKIQNGYYVDVFARIDLRQKERVNKRNQVEDILTSSSQAAPSSANGIVAVESQHKDTAQEVTKEISQQRQQREQGAAAQGVFNYIPYSDGKIVYSRNGLTDRVENERVVDEFGNVNYRNSYNYQYDNKRLLTGFETDTKDILGNITHTRQYGMKYTADSLFYASKDTNANKNIIEYTLEETDSAGNKKVTHFWGGSYDGKFLRAFSQTIEDSIYGNLSFTRSNITYESGNLDRIKSYREEGVGTDGLAYTLERTNITYNDKYQLSGYYEEKITTNSYGEKTKIITVAQFKYLPVPHQFGPDVEESDPDRLLESTITTLTENPDGSKRTETTTTSYKYDLDDPDRPLIDAQGKSVFTGREGSWYEYTDSQGRILTRKIDDNGNVTYTYVDPETKETITVPEEKVTATLKEGMKYSGTSQIKYEIPYGKPMVSEVNSTVSYYLPESLQLNRTEVSKISYINGLVNNLPRELEFTEHTEITYSQKDEEGNPQREIRDIKTTNIYAKNGNLIDAQGKGQTSGYELTEDGWMYFKGEIDIDYVIILNERKQKEYKEHRDYWYGTTQ